MGDTPIIKLQSSNLNEYILHPLSILNKYNSNVNKSPSRKI